MRINRKRKGEPNKWRQGFISGVLTTATVLAMVRAVMWAAQTEPLVEIKATMAEPAMTLWGMFPIVFVLLIAYVALQMPRYVRA